MGEKNIKHNNIVENSYYLSKSTLRPRKNIYIKV